MRRERAHLQQQIQEEEARHLAAEQRRNEHWKQMESLRFKDAYFAEEHRLIIALRAQHAEEARANEQLSQDEEHRREKQQRIKAECEWSTMANEREELRRQSVQCRQVQMELQQLQEDLVARRTQMECVANERFVPKPVRSRDSEIGTIATMRRSSTPPRWRRIAAPCGKS